MKLGRIQLSGFKITSATVETVDAAEFVGSPTGKLVPIQGNDPRYGPWQHIAFCAHPLAADCPSLKPQTYNAIADARGALGALDSSARQLPSPDLLSLPVLRREAQSTSALEGTYAPLEAVLAADEEVEQGDATMREIVNYMRMALHAYAWRRDGRPLSLNLLTELHRLLVRGTDADTEQAGRIRTIQVVIGGNRGGRVRDARFVPHPPGDELDRRVRDWVKWFDECNHLEIDPVVAAGMAHYQLETLHPFNDGNGRIGRLLIVLHFLYSGVLDQPILTVSPWFEARRADYYNALMGVSTSGDWDTWLQFFATGIAASARQTDQQLRELLGVQTELKRRIRESKMRAETAMRLVDLALARPIFTTKQAARHLGVSNARAHKLIGQLEELGILRQHETAYPREFSAPELLAVVLRGA